MKKNICHIISNLNVGGAEQTLSKIVLGLKNEFNFTVISLTDIGIIGIKLQENGINVINLNIKKKSSFFYCSYKLYKIIKILKPDIVHTWMYHSDLFGGIISKIAGVKLIYWNIRNSNLISGTSFTTRIIGYCNAIFSYFIPNLIVLVSNNSKLYHSKLGYSKNKMIVIPNGYEPSVISNTYKLNDSLKKELNIGKNSFVIGSIARYNLYKDHNTFIRSALKILKNNTSNKNLIFILIGKGVTEDNTDISNLINGSKYINNFILLGEQSDVMKFYSIFDIFCLHSISEAFPNVLAEAMSIGLPCVSTNVGDVSLMLNHKFCIVPSRNINDLAASLTNLINLDKNQLLQIGQINKNTISKVFSIENLFNNYKKIYNIHKNENK